MTAILWILIIIAFALAFIGLIKPVIPSLLMLWIGFLIYQFGFHEGRLSWIFLCCNDYLYHYDISSRFCDE